MRRELICLAPATPPKLNVRDGVVPTLGADDVLVRVQATSVNPIDLKRAGGYGRRLLSLKGAGHFPLIVGNDFVGHVEETGSGVTGFQKGQRVYGLIPTGKGGGAHASKIVASKATVMAAPEGITSDVLATLPYCFTTMWLAVRSTGLSEANARGKSVLVHGAAGALGRLSLRLLNSWGCSVTAVCRPDHAQACRELGAQRTVNRGGHAIQGVPQNFDVVLNFASWEDDEALASRLSAHALGQATTVHPLLSNFDRYGWLGGASTSWRDFAKVRSQVRQRTSHGRYAWTVFKPSQEALQALDFAVRNLKLSLPVGVSVSFEHADEAFSHVAEGKFGRAVLFP